MIGIIDRFEGDFAVVELENEEMINIKRKDLPQEANEGDVLDINHKITINYEKTRERKDKIKSMTEDLWEE